VKVKYGRVGKEAARSASFFDAAIILTFVSLEVVDVSNIVQVGID
jgi:hypothetical protein